MALTRDYNEDIQKLLVSVLLSNDEIFSRCQNILNSKYFINKLRPVVRYILEYAEQYRSLPPITQVEAQFGIELQQISGINSQQQQAFLDQIEEFCRNRALAEAVLSAPELIQKGNYGEVERRVKEAILVGLSSDIGTSYFSDPRERLMRIKNNNGQVSTGWAAIDQKLYGGINRKELTIWVAGPGGGKSVTLQNLSVNLVRSGLNVVYISLELSEEMISMRLDSMVTQVPTQEIFKRLDDVEIKVLQYGKKSGKLHVKQLPQGSTTNDIKAYLKNYEIETGKKCDVLMVDYIDLMFPNNKKIDVSNLFVKDKFVSEELRRLAVEFNIIVQSASQLNRSGLDQPEVGQSNIGGGISKIQTADNVISMLCTPAMRDRGQYQFQFLKTRSSSGVGSKIMMGYQPDTLRIFDIDQDTIETPAKTAADLMNDLKRKNKNDTVQEQPVAVTPPAKTMTTLKDLTNLIRR